jgi:hypothetical protein
MMATREFVMKRRTVRAAAWLLAALACLAPARAEYQPQSGRFLQRDPNETAVPVVTTTWFHGQPPPMNNPAVFDAVTLYGDGMNLYPFVQSNPVNLRDPLGLSVWDEDIDDFIGEYAGGLGRTRNTLNFMQRFMARGHFLSMAYANAAFAWDDFVWDRDEAILLGLVTGGFFAGACFEGGTPVLMADGSMRAIEDLRPGDVVASRRLNPTEGMRTVEPDSWRTVHTVLEDDDCRQVSVALLRPTKQAASLDASIGESVRLAFPELGIRGAGTILSIEKPPATLRVKGDDRVVTGTFSTEFAPIVDVYLEGFAAPIGTTRTHPFYSLDRSQWVRAGSLRDGERIATADGAVRVQAVFDRGASATAYTLEVADGHTFFASDAKAWVHNACSLNQINTAIRRGQAPKSITRLDWRRLGPTESPHLHFDGGRHALNIDGSWKHGGRALSNKEKTFLQDIGWPLPRE